jgi:hypothetical protein
MNKCKLDHFLFLRAMSNAELTEKELEVQSELFNLYWRNGKAVRNSIMPMILAAERLRSERFAMGWRRS